MDDVHVDVIVRHARAAVVALASIHDSNQLVAVEVEAQIDAESRDGGGDD